MYFFVEIPRSLDTDAVEAVLEMLEKGMTVSQIAILANSSSRASVEDAIASQSGVLEMIVSRYSADPTIDTVELKRRDIASKLGGAAAERLLNVDLSPLSALKQHRQQLIELTTLLNGTPVPVDTTDDDMVHLNAMLSRLAPLLSSEMPLDSSAQMLEVALQHADQHVQSALQKGIKPAMLSEITGILEEARALIQGPTTEGRAATAVAPATSPGAAPVTSVSPSSAAPSETTPSGVAGGIQSAVASVASPARPTPPAGG
jgi:hypothetical protein